MSDDNNQKCFVIRSFSPALRNVWELAIKPAIEKASLDPWDGEEERLGSNIIHKDISYLIWESRLVVADLTGRSGSVMYELGMAHAAKKPVIMLIDQDEIPPFDVTHIRYLKYDKHNLKKLQDDLTSRIISTLNVPPEQNPDFFPELQILTPALKAELTYLRSTAVLINITVFPKSGDVFFNDRLIGTGDQKILVNPHAARNTISASTVGFFEHHAEITEKDIEAKKVDIILEKVYQPGVELLARLSKRLPAWLRDRRRDPHNPVLMRAISSYLLMIGENSDAFEEIQDLLQVAPGWFMAINQMGLYYGISGLDWHRALSYYQQVATLNPNHFIGHFNMACIYSLLEDCEKCLFHLYNIVNNDLAAASIRETLNSLSHDPDFRNVISNDNFCQQFREIELQLFPEAKEIDWKNMKGAEYYTF